MIKYVFSSYVLKSIIPFVLGILLILGIQRTYHEFEATHEAVYVGKDDTDTYHVFQAGISTIYTSNQTAYFHNKWMRDVENINKSLNLNVGESVIINIGPKILWMPSSLLNIGVCSGDN